MAIVEVIRYTMVQHFMVLALKGLVVQTSRNLIQKWGSFENVLTDGKVKLWSDLLFLGNWKREGLVE